MLPYIENSTSVHVMVNEKMLSFEFDRFDRATVLKLIKAGDGAALLLLNKPIERVKKVLCRVGDVRVEETGEVFYKDTPLVNSLTERIASYVIEGHEIKHLVLFLNKLLSNPSYNCKQFLYKFLEHKNLPITEGGHFLAYKGVTTDFKDCHTQTFDNSVGQVVKMDRSEVDDNPQNYCSRGLHVGALEYARNFGAKTVIVKVDPSNVVSVPTDSNFQKMRVSEYEVIAEYEKPLDDNFESTCEDCDCEDYQGHYSDYDEYDYDDEYEEDVEEDEEVFCDKVYLHYDDWNEAIEDIRNLISSGKDVFVKLSRKDGKTHLYNRETSQDWQIASVSSNNNFRLFGWGGLWYSLIDNWDCEFYVA